MQKVKKEIETVLEGLTTYAIERQNGCERHQPDGAPPWSVMRRFWTDAITQSMARLAGLEPDPGWMAQYDQRLWRARGYAMTEPAPLQMQKDTIRTLRKLVFSLEQAGDDRRRQTAVIRDLLDDMSLHLSWDWRRNGVDAAREDAEQSLLRMTARLPIRFTRILLGGERGPGETGIVGGTVIEPEEVRETELFRSLSGQHPEVAVWPAICTTYAGAGGIGLKDADEYDLGIIREAGDRFLDLPEVKWSGCTRELKIPAEPAMGMRFY